MGKTILQRDLLDINADLVPLAILEGGRRVTRPPAPPGGESKKVSPLTEKTVGGRTLGFFSLRSAKGTLIYPSTKFSPEALETTLVFADCLD